MADQLSGPPGLDDPGGFYRQLFSAMNDGVCLHELVYDDMGRPGDYRILDVNPRYEEILGLGRDAVVGKTAMQVYGTKDPPYLDIFAEVAQTGSATHFETCYPAS